MDTLQQKQFLTSRSLTYNYYTTDPSIASSDITLVLFHGWPASASLWEHMIPYLSSLPYRIIVPDFLGFGGTSKPSEPEAYNVKHMVNDVMELLHHENVDKFIPIGHDFGSWLCQRVYLVNSERCPALILLSVAYMPPMLIDGLEISLDLFLSIRDPVEGYCRYEYFEFFVADDCAKVMDDHLESLYTLIHGDKKGTIREFFCERGAFRKYLEEGRIEPVKEHARDPKEKEAFISRLQRDGMTGPQCWYRSMTQGIQFQAEKEMFTPEQLVIKNPVLFIGCADDAVATTNAIDGPKAEGLLPDLTVHELDCSHYCPLEKPAEVSQLITDFLKQKQLL